MTNDPKLDLWLAKQHIRELAKEHARRVHQGATEAPESREYLQFDGARNRLDLAGQSAS